MRLFSRRRSSCDENERRMPPTSLPLQRFACFKPSLSLAGDTHGPSPPVALAPGLVDPARKTIELAHARLLPPEHADSASLHLATPTRLFSFVASDAAAREHWGRALTGAIVEAQLVLSAQIAARLCADGAVRAGGSSCPVLPI